MAYPPRPPQGPYPWFPEEFAAYRRWWTTMGRDDLSMCFCGGPARAEGLCALHTGCDREDMAAQAAGGSLTFLPGPPVAAMVTAALDHPRRP